MCVKPWPMSQISSSWRRTLRWLRANPPGRSDAASRSLMTQQKHAARAPGPSVPHVHASDLRGEWRVPSRRAAAAHRRRGADVVHAHDRARPGRRAHTTVASVRVVARVGRVAVAESRAPRNDLRDAPDERPARRRARRARRGARAARGCARAVLPNPMPGSAHSASAAMPAARARAEPIEQEVADLGARRRRSAGRAASCGARPACA